MSCLAIPVIGFTLKKLYEYNRKREEAEAERLKKTLAENRERGLVKAEELAYFLFPVLKDVERGEVNQILFKRLVVEHVAYSVFPELMVGATVSWAVAHKLAELGLLLDETGALFGVPKASQWIYDTCKAFRKVQTREAFTEVLEQEKLRQQRQENFDAAMAYLARMGKQ
jgi:hypothetical protein